MIIRITGGLGNQLFQYALARKMDLIDQKEILFDIDTDSAYTKRSYVIDYFSTKKYETISSIKSRLYRVYRNNIDSNWAIIYKNIIRYGEEKDSFVYQDVRKYKYLDGYWQNALYFSDIMDRLQNEIVYRFERNTKQQGIEKLINSSASVAIHVRRGDYLSSKNKKIYVSQEIEYYKRAINILCEKVYQPVFFVFSDDIMWCKENMAGIDNLYFIDSEINKNAIEDFEMMRQCKHFIISNSTFSWWSSKLSNNPNKLIISPSRWYVDENVNKRCQDALLQNVVMI